MTRLSRESPARRGVRLDLWSPSSGALSSESPNAFHEDEGSLFRDRSLSVELRRCLRLFLHAFQVAYGFRAGISICARIVGLMRREPKRLLSLDAIFSEDNLVMRTESIRQGLFVGGLVAGTELVAALISKYRRRDDGWSIAVGGACGGVALLLQHRQTRRTLALYALTRLLQCIYRSAKRRGIVQPLKHGDALMFMASSAQIMYSWVMRPDTLPPSFFSFITKTGPIHKTVLETVRRCNRGDPLDLSALEAFLRARLPPGSTDEIERRLAAVKDGIVPCSVLHPQQPACTMQLLQTFADAIRKVLPLYASLTIVPVLLFKLKKVLRSPVHYVVALSVGLARSLLFIGSFVSLYMGSACMLRSCCSTFNHRSVYFLFGLVSSLSIFIERKARRSELALYTLPRGVDSLFQLLVDRRFLSAVPFGDVLLFCSAMSGLMFFYRYDRESMPPLLARICDFLFKERGLMHRDRSFYSPASP